MLNIIVFFRLSISYFSGTIGMNPPTKVYFEHFLFFCGGRFSLETFCYDHCIGFGTARVDEHSTKNSLFFLHQYPYGPKHFTFNFSRYSNTYFTETTGSVCAIRVGIEKILVVKRFLMRELSICDAWISVLTVWNFQEDTFFRSILKLVFLSHYKLELLHQEVI